MFQWKSQISTGNYHIQIETDDIEKYKVIEKLLQDIVNPKEKNNFIISVPYNENIEFNSVCDNCSSNPKNGGTGICNCSLPTLFRIT